MKGEAITLHGKMAPAAEFCEFHTFLPRLSLTVLSLLTTRYKAGVVDFELELSSAAEKTHAAWPVHPFVCNSSFVLKHPHIGRLAVIVIS